MIVLKEDALEGKTYAVAFSLKDEDGGTAGVTSVTWTLTDPAGSVINNRSGVAIDPAVAIGDILLSGDDLALQDPASLYEWRLVTVEATYNSSLGSGLELAEEIWFRVRALVAA